MRQLFGVLAILAVASCGPREHVDFAAPAPGAHLQPVLVAHLRAPDPEQPVPGRERAERLGFGLFQVAIPPDREPGRIDRPARNRPADPSRHFTLAAREPLDSAGFRRAIAQALARQPTREREVTIFVHGFNTTFIEGLYRVAQLGHDLDVPGVLAHYSWPSLGAPLAYAHDRDSALLARDGLQGMIAESVAAGARRVVLIAHSMGAQLTMETLRQMALDGSLPRTPLAGVVLIAPDIDVDLFRAQARRIGRLPQPFLVVTSRRDRILQLSARLTGQPDRLGNLSDPTRVADLDVSMLDVSSFGTGDGHFTLAQSPALIRLLGRIGAVDAALAADASGRLPLVPGTILILQNTTETLLQVAADPRARRRLPWRILPIAEARPAAADLHDD